MAGYLHQIRRRPHLHYPAGVEDRHPIGQLGRGRYIVGRHQDDLLSGDLLQQLDHLRLGDGVQRRRRLVQDENLGVVGQSHGDEHPLLLPAAQLVGVGCTFLRRESHRPEEINDLLSGGVTFVDQDGLFYLVGDLVDRVESVFHVLEDHGHIFAPYFAVLFFTEGEDVPPVEEYLARASVQKAHYAQAEGGLARA